jgi:hypothetical protein
MKNACALGGVVAALLVAVPAASGGGSFERIVGVGANGVSRTIELRAAGPRSEAALEGAAVGVPAGGFVRVYPWIGNLPAVPGRYYPAARVLCLSWREPPSSCTRLGAAGVRLLAPLARLSLRRLPPTAPVEVRYRSRTLRYADGNVFAALELALERVPVTRAPSPPDAVELAVTWRGPLASRRPATLFLSPAGVYASHRLFPLQRGPWCYLAGNLPHASAELIEATMRVCNRTRG